MRIISILLAGLLGLASARADLVTGFHNTGTSSTNGLDNYWTVSAEFNSTTQISAMLASSKSAAYVIPSTTWPVNQAWAADTAAASWITPNVTSFTNGNHTDASGYYIFETTVNLSGYNLSTFSFNGTIGVDNSIYELIVNSHVVTISTGSVSLFESSFTTSSISQYLVSGVNTFDFVVYNTPSSGNASDNGNLTGTNPTGLLINATVTATPSAVPEPSTYALFGAAGTLSLAGLRSLRRRKA